MGTDMKVVDASIIVISNKCKAGKVETDADQTTSDQSHSLLPLSLSAAH
jgi:hypothetical protein